MSARAAIASHVNRSSSSASGVSKPSARWTTTPSRITPRPLVNAPLIGVITTRTPEALRAKVMTAVLTMAMLAGPVGLATAGPLLDLWGPRPVFLLVAAGQLLATTPFAFVAFRTSESPTRPREASPLRDEVS